jgi:hypothetical protein
MINIYSNIILKIILPVYKHPKFNFKIELLLYIILINRLIGAIFFAYSVGL